MDSLLWTSKSNDKFTDLKTLVTDDVFLNTRRWFQDDLKTVLDDSNNVFNDTFFFFDLHKVIVFPLKNFDLGFETVIGKNEICPSKTRLTML